MGAISLSRSTALVLAFGLLAVLALAGQRLARGGAASAPDVVAPLEIEERKPAGRALVVHVVGAVRRPGLLRLRDGARVADAVARAGGATARADLSALNLAAPLVDGVQVLVPRIPALGAAGAGAIDGARATRGAPSVPAYAAGGGAKPSLATATAEQLDELPGVGPITAQKILDYRAEHGPFRAVEDLDAVPGIGPATVEELRDLVTP